MKVFDLRFGFLMQNCIYFTPRDLSGTELNNVFRCVLFCCSFCLVIGGPGGGFGGPGGGFLLNSRSRGFATTFTTN